MKVARMLFPMKDTDLHRNPVWIELRDFYLEQWVCYFGNQRVRVVNEGSWMSEAAATFSGKETVLLEPTPGQAHWRSPLQHALGRAPDLDGRFYTPEYQAHPAVQAELVDDTGNNIKRMQDSEVYFLHRTYENCVQSLELQEQKSTGVFVMNILSTFGARTKERQKGSCKGIARVLCTETMGACVWLRRPGRLRGQIPHS